MRFIAMMQIDNSEHLTKNMSNISLLFNRELQGHNQCNEE